MTYHRSRKRSNQTRWSLSSCRLLIEASRGRHLTDSSGVDFDDPDYGFKEEDKDPEKVSIHNQDSRHLLMN